jgi:thiaminase
MSGRLEKRNVTTEWLKQNHELYTAATNHCFIKSIRDGTVDVNNFKHWMVRRFSTGLRL